MAKGMPLNYHIHTTGSDGKLTPEEVVKEAISKGLKFICITDHYILPIRDWGNGRHKEEYYFELERLKRIYGNKIDISIGIEFDWIEDYYEWLLESVRKRKIDYVLCSVHFLKRSSSQYDPIDFSPELNKEIASDYGGIKELVEKYFIEIRKMVTTGIIDCVAHMDLIKKYLNLPIKDLPWYKKEVIKTLEVIKKADVCIEVNASGWRTPANEQYPSEFILKESFKRKIPITIGNDFHQHEGNMKTILIDEDLERAYDLVRKVGYNKICRFKNRKRFELEIN